MRTWGGVLRAAAIAAAATFASVFVSGSLYLWHYAAERRREEADLRARLAAAPPLAPRLAAPVEVDEAPPLALVPPVERRL